MSVSLAQFLFFFAEILIFLVLFDSTMKIRGYMRPNEITFNNLKSLKVSQPSLVDIWAGAKLGNENLIHLDFAASFTWD